MNTDKIVAELFEEAGEDYVGLWQLFRALPQAETSQDLAAEVLEIVRQLLSMPGVRVGQFERAVFVPWTGDSFEVIARLENQLRNLGRVPNIGEVAWFAREGLRGEVR